YDSGALYKRSHRSAHLVGKTVCRTRRLPMDHSTLVPTVKIRRVDTVLFDPAPSISSVPSSRTPRPGSESASLDAASEQMEVRLSEQRFEPELSPTWTEMMT